MLWVLDVNETLLDLTPVDAVLGAAGAGPGAVREWFELTTRAAVVLTATGGGRPFAEIGAAAAEQLVVGSGGRWSDSLTERLSSTLAGLPAHAEVAPFLGRLRSAGQRVVALTNSAARTAEQQLAAAELAELVDAVHSVEAVGRLKPAPEVYAHLLALEGVPADRTVLVAAHDWDVAGAAAAGMATVLLTRGGHPPLPGHPRPDVVVHDLTAAVEHPVVRGWLGTVG